MVELLTESLSPQMVPVAITIAAIVLAFVLISIMRRVVMLLLGRLAPGWVDKVTMLLQIAVLVGEFAIIGSFFVPNEWKGWLAEGAILLFMLVSGFFLAGNSIRNGVAALRIRGFRYYRVGDWVTVANNVQGLVIAIQPFNTLVRTPKQELIAVQNRLVIGAPIHVHRSQQEIAALTAIAHNYRTTIVSDEQTPVVQGDQPENSQVLLSTDTVEGTVQVASTSQLLHATLPLPTALLTRRPVLGKKSITPLIRS